MSPRFFLCLLFCGCAVLAKGQFPDLSSYLVVRDSTTNFSSSRGGDAHEMSKTEVPPWIVGGGNNYKSYFLTDGRNSGVFSTQQDIVNSTAIDPARGGGPFWTSFSEVTSDRGGCPVGESQPWRRDYYGIYSAQYIQPEQTGPVTLGFLHAENKDLCMDGRDCHGDFNAGRDTCFDGDLWPRYNALVCASWTTNDQQTDWGQHYFANDIGPIAWPSTGYLQPNGVKASCGIGIPSSIVYNGYVYVFFMDHGPYGGLNPEMEDGRLGGVKVVRAEVNNALDPNAYMAYYRDSAGNDTWSPSLPAGFTREGMLQFLRAKGPKTTDIMNEAPWNSAPLRFSVAMVRNANYFIGVESYVDLQDGNRYKTALRCSSDLLHWSSRMLVISDAAGFESSTMNYPVFLSKDGSSNTVIDADDFFVLGTRPGKSVNSVVYKLHIQASEAYNSNRVVAMAATAFSSDRQVSCFPNPTFGRSTLALQSVTGDVTIRIIDMEGRVVFNTQWVGMGSGPASQNLDLSNLAAGIYVIQVSNGGTLSILELLRE
ncbi:MAG TPA: T9SS type A sorting domain-containing protein [Puia sp.]|jgi:hypothetical protein|nr:T9SS type A sorting domain-containing protein [Puia sp.]